MSNINFGGLAVVFFMCCVVSLLVGIGIMKNVSEETSITTSKYDEETGECNYFLKSGHVISAPCNRYKVGDKVIFTLLVTERK